MFKVATNVRASARGTRSPGQLSFNFGGPDCIYFDVSPVVSDPPVIIEGQQHGFYELFFGLEGLAWWPYYGLGINDECRNPFLLDDEACRVC